MLTGNYSSGAWTNMNSRFRRSLLLGIIVTSLQLTTNLVSSLPVIVSCFLLSCHKSHISCIEENEFVQNSEEKFDVNQFLSGYCVAVGNI